MTPKKKLRNKDPYYARKMTKKYLTTKGTATRNSLAAILRMIRKYKKLAQ